MKTVRFYCYPNKPLILTVEVSDELFARISSEDDSLREDEDGCWSEDYANAIHQAATGIPDGWTVNQIDWGLSEDA